MQEYLQARKIPLPSYNVIDTKGQAHNQVFTVECLIQDKPQVVAKGSSRRKAEQKAAELALQMIKDDAWY